MTAKRPLPTPEQIHTWLGAHGWTRESPIPADPADGLDFFYKEPADDGEPFMVRTPQTVEATPLYPLLVHDVIVTAAGMEDRPEAEVLAEMLAVEPARPALPPSVPSVALAQSPAGAGSSD